MVAFAVGGLLGDTLFHLLPEIFLGEDTPDRVHFVLVEPNRNLILGLAIMVGFMTFVAMDKGLRIATGGAGHDHSHGAHSHDSSSVSATSSSIEISGKDVKNRRKGTEKDSVIVKESEEKEANPSVKLAGFLNLMYVMDTPFHFHPYLLL
jgi:zinc transporter 7